MRFSLLSILLLSVILAGCSTTKSASQKNVFTFQINDNTYQITSLNTESGEGVNTLQQVNEERALTARDINQDGLLDLVLEGEKSLDEANEIYLAGIRIAQESGSYRERTVLRKFEWETDTYKFVLTSYTLNNAGISNVLVIGKKSDFTEHIFIDLEADGILDSVEKGTLEIEIAQEQYELVLAEGILNELIQKEGTYYLVLENRFPPLSSL